MDPETSQGNLTSMKKVGLSDAFLHQLLLIDRSESHIFHLFEAMLKSATYKLHCADLFNLI